MEYANESRAAFLTDEEAWRDRCLFVKNLGILISQTREQVESCELLKGNLVKVNYRGGNSKLVNVECDSYAAIARDVLRHGL